jgi:hypothetical protein
MDEHVTNQPTQNPNSGGSTRTGATRGGIVGGLILVMIGIGLLIVQFTNLDEGVIVGFLGVAFLIAAVATRTYGLAIPGCILSGLGVGLLLQGMTNRGQLQLQEPVPIGLGLGFIAIWVFDQFFTKAVPSQGRWWPLIPGGILLGVGVVNNLPNFQDYTPYLLAGALIIIGGVIIVRALMGRGTGTS